MNEYNFWADLLFTFQSSPDWIKALWLLVPPGFMLVLIRMLMRFGLALRPRQEPADGKSAIPLRYRSEGALEMTDYSRLPEEVGELLPLLSKEDRNSIGK